MRLSLAYLRKDVLFMLVVVFAGLGGGFPARSAAQLCDGNGCMAAPSPWVFASSTDSDKCLAKEGIPDVSCDGEVRIAVLGDSIVAGVGDEQYGDSGGGYVTRARMRLPSVTLAGVGKPGQTTEQLYRLVKTTLAGSSFPKLRATLSDADVIFLDIGRNDWWSVARRKEPPTSPTYGRIRRLQKYLRDRLAMLSGRTPIVVVSRLLLPNRGGQGPWVGRLNRRLGATSSLYLPANLRFDLVSKRLYNADQLHPTALGYEAVTDVFVYYLTKVVPRMWADILDQRA